MQTKINLLITTMSEAQINLTSKEMTFCEKQFYYNIKRLFPSHLLYSCQLGNMLEEDTNMTRQNVVPSKNKCHLLSLLLSAAECVTSFILTRKTKKVKNATLVCIL